MHKSPLAFFILTLSDTAQIISRESSAGRFGATRERGCRGEEKLTQIQSRGFRAMTHKNRFVSVLGSALVVAAMAGYACAAGYTQTNLVSNGAVPAAHTDPNLVNPWGISFFPGGSPFWISDNNAGVTTLYDGTGSPFPAPATPLVVDIPSPTDPTHGGATGAPTGQVANLTIATATPAFIIPNTQSATPPNFGPALFIFATEDGTILAWNSPPFASPGIPEPDGPSPLGITDDALIVVDNSTSGEDECEEDDCAGGAVYKGLALATRKVGTNANVPFLYATNFRTGNIDVFDGTFGPATVPGEFKDEKVQEGYAPFGIQNINNHLWVTYAQQDAARHDSVNKPGHGYVSVFDTDGNLLSHFAQRGHLNSPWGVGLAPASFGKFANDILIGNFGDGLINAYDPAKGRWLGMLSDASGNPIINPGLWSVTFSGPAGATATNATPDTLYITAGLVGPTHENAGLFAKISPNP
jgi:uncharacterized protein (TIGR03118 family)